MAKKSSKIELPKWASNLWKELGSPDLESIQGITQGDLLERRNGLRRDDLVEIQIDAFLWQHFMVVRHVISFD